MATVRLVNPALRKALTRDELERRQAQAVQFTRDIAGDPDLADEIEHLTVDEYATRKGFLLVNSSNREEVNTDMTTRTARTSQQPDIGAKVDRLTEAIEQLRNNGSTPRRANPAGEQVDDLAEKLGQLSDAIEQLRHSRLSNPEENENGPSAARAQRQVAKLRRDRDEILEAVEAAQDALDEGQADEAQDILDDIFDQYEIEESK